MQRIMSYNLSQIMKSAHRNYKKGGKIFVVVV